MVDSDPIWWHGKQKRKGCQLSQLEQSPSLKLPVANAQKTTASQRLRNRELCWHRQPRDQLAQGYVVEKGQNQNKPATDFKDLCQILQDKSTLLCLEKPVCNTICSATELFYIHKPEIKWKVSKNYHLLNMAFYTTRLAMILC